MKTLTREKILQASDIKTEKVNVPQWEGAVNVRTMTGTERDIFEQALLDSREKNTIANIRARLCALVVVDDEGKHLFTEEDITELGKKSSAALDIIFTVAQRMNGISKGDIKELEKNSDAAQKEGSTSG